LIERDALRAQVSLLEQQNADCAVMRIARAEGRLIMTDYPYAPCKRAIEATAGGTRIVARLSAEEDQYAALLSKIGRHTESLRRIPRDQTDSNTPFWANEWFPPFDAASLYGLIAELSPRRYIEVGSGNSTKFARQAM